MLRWFQGFKICFFHYYSPAPSEPQAFNVVTKTDVRNKLFVTWKVPNPTNGDITAYEIQYKLVTRDGKPTENENFKTTPALAADISKELIGLGKNFDWVTHNIYNLYTFDGKDFKRFLYKKIAVEIWIIRTYLSSCDHLVFVSTIKKIGCGEIAFSYFESDKPTLSWISSPPISMLKQKMCLENIDVGGTGAI